MQLEIDRSGGSTVAQRQKDSAFGEDFLGSRATYALDQQRQGGRTGGVGTIGLRFGGSASVRSSPLGALRGGRFVDDRGFFTGGQDAVPVPDFVQYGYGVFIGTQPACIGANFGTGDHAEAGAFKSCGQGARIRPGLCGGSSSASGRRIRDQQFEPARTGLGAYAW